MLLLYGQTKPSSAAQFYATHRERNVPAFDKIVIVNNCSEKGGPHANLNHLIFFHIIMTHLLLYIAPDSRTQPPAVV